MSNGANQGKIEQLIAWASQTYADSPIMLAGPFLRQQANSDVQVLTELRDQLVITVLAFSNSPTGPFWRQFLEASNDALSAAEELAGRTVSGNSPVTSPWDQILTHVQSKYICQPSPGAGVLVGVDFGSPTGSWVVQLMDMSPSGVEAVALISMFTDLASVSDSDLKALLYRSHFGGFSVGIGGDLGIKHVMLYKNMDLDNLDFAIQMVGSNAKEIRDALGIK